MGCHCNSFSALHGVFPLQGGVFVCRRNQLWAIALIGFGLGLLAAGFFESVFFCGSLGIVFMVIGIVVFQKK